MNNILLQSMLDKYNDLSYTNKYIIGFSYKGIIYAVKVKHDTLYNIVSLDTDFRNAGYAIRFKPNNTQKEYLLKNAIETIVLCSKKYFEDYAHSTKYNRGEVFEKLVYEYYNMSWKKDNIPFTKSGDIVINAIHYQIKYEKATFVSEYTLHNMEKRKI